LEQGRVQEAEQMMTAVVQRRRELLPLEHPDYSSGLINLANTVFTGGKFAEAEKIYRDALALVRKNRGEENPTMALLLQNIATTIAEQGRPADAKPMYELAAKMRKKLLGENHPSFITSLDSIADMQRLLGNHAEAETLYKESFNLSRKSQGLAHPSSIRSLGYLSSALLEQKKFSELETLLNDVLTPEFASIPASVPVLSLRTEFLARSGRWREATRDARAALSFDRNDHMRYHTLAPLLAIQNLQSEYRALCLEISRRFSDTSNAFVADRMAKDCIILPLPDFDLAPIRAMADVAIAKGTNLPAAPFFYVCKAATELRSGKYASAESWANKALTSPYSYSAVEGLAVAAIAQQKQGKREEFSTNLAAAHKIIREQFPTIEKGDLGSDWRDWIIAHTLIAEVETLE
jgi:eukaryotic-like serine/threonine-protein kinase